LDNKILERALEKLGIGGEVSVCETPVNVKSFGRKKLSKIEITHSQGKINLICKVCSQKDMPMFLSGNPGKREQIFYESELAEELEKHFFLPHLIVFNKSILMWDVDTELKSFGPPNIPTEKQMRTIIQTLARKDATTLHTNQPWLAKYGEIYSNTGQLFRALAEPTKSPDLVKQCRREWPWLEQGYLAFAKKHPGKAIALQQAYADPAFTSALEHFPHSVQHGDFYFNNIGLNQGNEVVAIDWENVMWGPVGFDFSTLVNGMPELPYSKNYLSWYVTEFNAVSPITLSDKQAHALQSTFEPWLFLTSELLDGFRFGYCPDSPLPLEHREAIRQQMLAKLDELKPSQQL